ncbi:MAG TPA: hypothetical protein VFT22_41160 [Kofleriaceae bacterium]|nr:hypothetical protein [Kofleriaceae bacterium]
MPRSKKINGRRSVKRVDIVPKADDSVVVNTRAGVEARADAIARDLGVDRKKAFRMLEEGKLRGTAAELRLAPLRFLLS